MSADRFYRILVFVGVIFIIFLVFQSRHFFYPTKSYLGVLTISRAEGCAIPEGCGHEYRLWDKNFDNFIVLKGDFKNVESGLIISAAGKEIGIFRARGDEWGRRPAGAAMILSYNVLSNISYHRFLVNEADKYTIDHYPCLASYPFGDETEPEEIGTLWEKQYSWDIDENNIPVLKVKVIEWRKQAPKPYYELWYNATNGELIKEVIFDVPNDICHK